jgi:hypothetical protein
MCYHGKQFTKLVPPTTEITRRSVFFTPKIMPSARPVEVEMQTSRPSDSADWVRRLLEGNGFLKLKDIYFGHSLTHSPSKRRVSAKGLPTAPKA